LGVTPPADKRRRATLADLYAIPEDERFHELIDGEIVEKAAPSGEHGGAQAGVVGSLLPSFGRRPGGRWPGGWWFASDVDIQLGEDICRPDVLGWRRDRVPAQPRGMPVRTIPDWVCEIVSGSNRRNDVVRKKRIYHRSEIGHYWILDPDEATLSVYRWHPDGYLEVLAAERGQRVRAEPFDAIELAVGVLFGDDPED
jgi:Uma2 family endonuclease